MIKKTTSPKSENDFKYIIGRSDFSEDIPQEIKKEFYKEWLFDSASMEQFQDTDFKVEGCLKSYHEEKGSYWYPSEVEAEIEVTLWNRDITEMLHKKDYDYLMAYYINRESINFDR